MLLGSYVLYAVIPVSSLAELALEIDHSKCLACLRITRTNIDTVTATEAVHHADLHTEVHTLHGSRSFHLAGSSTVEACEFFLIEHERTDTSVRTNIRTLVTLDTVVSSPNRNEGRHTTFLELSGSCRPCTVLDALERANREEVTVLTVDRTNDLGDELRLVAVVLSGISRQFRPCGIDSELLILTTAVHRSVVLINDILTLLAVRLHDEVLHLLNGLLNRNDCGDTEESRLEDGVGTVAQTDLLCDLRSVDVINFNLMVSEVFLHFVRQVLNQLVALPDGVQ